MTEANELSNQQQAGSPIDQSPSVYEVQTAPGSLIGDAPRTGESGVHVTETSVLDSIPAMAAVLIIAEAMGSLPLKVYKRLSPYGRERATDHPLYRMLNNEPNIYQSAQGWIETMVLHALLWGNAYSAIGRDELGRPEGLYPLLPDRTAPVRDPDSGVLFVKTRAGGEVHNLLAADVFHVMGPSLSGAMGINRVQRCRESLGTMLAADRCASKAYGQGVQPSGVIKHPKGIGPRAAENLRQDVERQHQGLSNFFKTIVLQEGASFEPFDVDFTKQQLLEARKFSIEEAGRLFHVPSVMLNHTEGANGGVSEQAKRIFIKLCLRPWGKRFQEEVDRKLLREDERDDYYAEFLYEDLLSGDFEGKREYYTKLYNMGAITPSEIRERENMNPYPDGVGTEPMVGQWTMPLRQVGEQQSADSSTINGLDKREYYGARTLSINFGVNQAALQARLDRWRRENPRGKWKVANGESLFRLGDVLHLVQGTSR